MKTTSCLAATLALATALQVHAHGGMISPKPRALTTMKLAIDSTFGHPIPMRASYTNGKGGDCLGFTPDTNLQSIPVGASKISMRANDGANHIGPCTVYLVNPQDKSNKLQVGSMKDCMRSLHPGPGNKGDAPIPAEMTINVPSGNLPCRDGHCVLEFSWEAQHTTPFEHYNNCADVKVAGGSSNNGGSEATSTPVVTPATEAPATAEPSAPADEGDSNASEPGTVAPASPEPIADDEADNATSEPETEAPTTPEPTADNEGDNSGKGSYVGSTADMTMWCNWNCPQFCPEDLCKLSA